MQTSLSRLKNFDEEFDFRKQETKVARLKISVVIVEKKNLFETRPQLLTKEQRAFMHEASDKKLWWMKLIRNVPRVCMAVCMFAVAAQIGALLWLPQYAALATLALAGVGISSIAVTAGIGLPLIWKFNRDIVKTCNLLMKDSITWDMWRMQQRLTKDNVLRAIRENNRVITARAAAANQKPQNILPELPSDVTLPAKMQRSLDIAAGAAATFRDRYKVYKGLSRAGKRDGISSRMLVRLATQSQPKNQLH